MAFLFDANTESYIPLAPHHTMGRLASIVDTHLDKPYISKLHATIEWRDERWYLKNLGLNGTHINGDLLKQGESHPLSVGDRIQLAELNDPAFKVIDLSPPVDMLWPLEHQQVPQPVALSRYHLLPDEQNPELTLFLQDQQWYIEPLSAHNEQAIRPVHNNERVEFNHRQWQLIRAQIYGPTEARAMPADEISKFEFIFDLSLDEECTQLHLQHEHRKIDLGIRSHHYLLLMLARHRAEDIARNLDSHNQSWVYADQLAAELGMDNTHMNIHIFRARKQLADALPNSQVQSSLLERRGGRIRLDCDKFKIYKGGNIINQAPHANENRHQALSV